MKKLFSDGTIEIEIQKGILWFKEKYKLYLHPQDKSIEEAHNNKDFGHNDWKRPTPIEMRQILNMAKQGDLSTEFHKKALYLTE